MRKVIIGSFPSATASILAAAMIGGMDGGSMMDLVPTYRDAEGDKRLAEAEYITSHAPRRSQADPEAERQKAAASLALTNRKTRTKKNDLKRKAFRKRE